MTTDFLSKKSEVANTQSTINGSTDGLCSKDQRNEILSMVPQMPPFRFIDQILELSDSHIRSSYRFTGEEWFYKGHFPGDPVTPGVILVEAMAQAGLVALGIHLFRKHNPDTNFRTLFTESQIEFLTLVRPGQEVITYGEKIYWRRNKLQSRVELRLENGELAACGTLSGMGHKI